MQCVEQHILTESGDKCHRGPFTWKSGYLLIHGPCGHCMYSANNTSCMCLFVLRLQWYDWRGCIHFRHNTFRQPISWQWRRHNDVTWHNVSWSWDWFLLPADTAATGQLSVQFLHLWRDVSLNLTGPGWVKGQVTITSCPVRWFRLESWVRKFTVIFQEISNHYRPFNNAASITFLLEFQKLSIAFCQD